LPVGCAAAPCPGFPEWQNGRGSPVSPRPCRDSCFVSTPVGGGLPLRLAPEGAMAKWPTYPPPIGRAKISSKRRTSLDSKYLILAAGAAPPPKKKTNQVLAGIPLCALRIAPTPCPNPAPPWAFRCAITHRRYTCNHMAGCALFFIIQ
jgi:hypothetical protein